MLDIMKSTVMYGEEKSFIRTLDIYTEHCGPASYNWSLLTEILERRISTA